MARQTKLSIDPAHPVRILVSVSRDRSTPVNRKIRALQKALLEAAEDFLDDGTLPRAIRDAFYETPRHAFAPRFPDGRPGLWSDVDDDLLQQHLDRLYADQPYCIFRNEDGETTSTISQPSLVIYMLHLLDLRPGHRVFELGGGSGWNAALMGRLVGESGEVTSVEIESAIVANAQQAISRLGLSNVSLVSGDAISEVENHDPFDRCVFTASAQDLPRFFFPKTKEGGLLVFVVKFTSEEDLLILLRKSGDHFVSELHFPCRFVPITRNNLSEPGLKPSADERRFLREFRSRGWAVEDLNLEIYPRTETREARTDEWDYTRGDSRFLWSFPKS